MRKILSLFAVFAALISFAHVSFAAPTYQATVQPISALKAKLPGEYGSDTVIVVINYSNNTIALTHPISTPWMGHNASTRVWAPNYTGPTFIRLIDGYGSEVWAGTVSYRDTISVDYDYTFRRYTIQIAHNG